ncbi:hypothetical protein KDK82_4361 [Delftia sp. K82]|uniref:hypothetical protein n=1 Tax=Delftia sp. K82 TaxID=1472718 RepID=UPI000B623D28|nr:hypothetical protein [Delftia sp. K82]OWG15113.1 hypothetical protein KDK82_4361 [Delftia sp. K82]
MFSLKPGATLKTAPHDLEQNFLAQWINKQLAFKEAFSNLPNSGNSFSPSQIDAIIALRRKSAEKQSHD